MKKGTVALGPATPNANSGDLLGGSFNGSVKGSIDAVSLGLRYRFGSNPVAAMPRGPVVTK